MFSCLERVKSLHVVEIGDLPLLVPDDWKRQIAAGDLVDILDPSSMTLDCVRRQSNELHAALGEFWLEFREGAQLGRANGCVVLWVREQHHPVIANELMEVDGSVGGPGIEVGSNASKTERFSALFSHGDLLGKKSSDPSKPSKQVGCISHFTGEGAGEAGKWQVSQQKRLSENSERQKRTKECEGSRVRHELNLLSTARDVCRLFKFSAIACSPYSLAQSLLPHATPSHQ